MTTLSSSPTDVLDLKDHVRGAIRGQLVGDAYPVAYAKVAALVLAALLAGQTVPEALAAAGGDNAGRAGILGAWPGAHLGVPAIPTGGRERLHAHVEISTNTEKLLSGSVGG